MENCLFYRNFVTGGLLVVRSNVLVPKHINQRNETWMFLFDHVVWHNLNFTSNFAENGLLQTTWNKELLNIDMRDCYFSRNALQSQHLIYIANIWKLVVAINGAYRNFYVPELNRVMTVWVYLRYINITNITFEDNSSFTSLLYMQGYANINVTNIVARRNGNFQSNAMTAVMMEYLNGPYIYGKIVPIFATDKECVAMVAFNLDVHFSVGNNTFDGNTCKSGGTGFNWVSCSGRAAVTDLYASGNKGAFDSGLIIDFFSPVNLTLKHLVLLRNTNDAGALVRFTSYCEVNLTDSSFENNIGQRGVCFQASEGLNLRVTNTKFKGNQAPANVGGVLQFTIRNLPLLKLEIVDSIFTNNSANEGGSIYVNSKERATVKLIFRRNSFVGNQATLTGAVFSIREDVTLESTSVIETCDFQNNQSPNGLIYTKHYSGTLFVTMSSFLANNGSISSCFSIETPPTASTLLTFLTFTRNTGGPAIMKPNNKVESSFKTESCVFSDNTEGAVTLQGGSWHDDKGQFLSSGYSAINLYSQANAHITNGLFLRNIGNLGGAIYAGSFSNFECVQCTFENNTANFGGVIYSEQDSIIIVSKAVFKGNKAYSWGSAIAILTSYNVVSKISDSSFYDNSSGISSIICLLYANIMLESVEIYNNQAARCPGIVMFLANFQMTASTVRNQGGLESGFMQLSDSSAAVISHSLFEHIYGELVGAISLTSSVVNITDSIFHDIDTQTSGMFFAAGVSVLSLRHVTAFSITSANIASLIQSADSTVEIIQCEFADYEFGGINGNKLNSLSIVDSIFKRGKGFLGGAVYCSQCVDVVITGSVFEEQQGMYGGAICIETLEGVRYVGKATLVRNVFANNTAIWGAGGYFNNENLTISECTFTNNTVSGIEGEGGALFLDCSVVEMCQVLVEQCQFERNIASRAGGAISWKLVKPSVQSITMVDNDAPYAPDIASFAIKIRLDSVFSPLPKKANSIDIPITAPGQPTGIVLTASLVDHYGHVTVLDNTSTGELLSSNQSEITVSGMSKVIAENGTFTFKDFMLYASPNSSATLLLSSLTISNDQPGDPDPHTPLIPIMFSLRACEMGESTTPYSCLVCGKGTYSFSPSEPCQNCPAHSTCLGNVTMIPDPGYWRYDIYSPIIWECPNPEACLGGQPDGQPLNLTGACATGYCSNKCQSCEIGFSRATKNKCGKCPNRDANIVKITFIVIAAILVVALLVSSSLKSATKQKALHSIYLKILMNYLQLVMLVTEFKLSWPQPVVELFGAQEQAGSVSEQAYSFDCLLAENQSTIDTYFTKIIFIAILPVGLLLILIVVWAAIATKIRKFTVLRKELPATIVIVFFMIHPNVVKSLFSLFSCTELKSGEFWLVIDMKIQCWTSKHYLYALSAGIPSIILWVFAVPLICLGILVKFRKRHDELWIKLQYGFLLSGYRRTRFYWEFVILYRKVAIIICAVFLNDSISIQALTVQFIILGFLVLQYNILPYISYELNSMELKAIIVADATIYCGLYYITNNLSNGSTWFFFVVIVLVNAYFLLYWISVMFAYAANPIARAIPCIGYRFRPQVFEYDKDIEALIASFGLETLQREMMIRDMTLVSLYKSWLHQKDVDDILTRATGRSRTMYTPMMPIVDVSASFIRQASNIATNS